jgi:uncharacterized oligopeptide transporter (OPT) family protein
MKLLRRWGFLSGEDLQFPDGLAAAEIIKSMYKKGRDKAEEAIQEKKVKVMMWFFLGIMNLLMFSGMFVAIKNLTCRDSLYIY